MSRRCSVCNHPQRHEIDVELVEGAPVRHVMSRFGLGRMAVQRHRESHLPEKLVRAKQVQDLTEAGELLSRVLGIEQRARRLSIKAEDAGDIKTALQGIDRVLRSPTLQGNLKERWETEAMLERLQELLEEKGGGGYAGK